MNDHHKFRLWDIKDKQYVPIKNIWYNEDGEIVSVCPQHRGKSLKQGEFILEQCLGLKDKNDRFVYEGDIYKDPYNRIIEVKFWYEMNYPECFVTDCIDCEIIGNINENPGLLEAK